MTRQFCCFICSTLYSFVQYSELGNLAVLAQYFSSKLRGVTRQKGCYKHCVCNNSSVDVTGQYTVSCGG